MKHGTGWLAVLAVALLWPGARVLAEQTCQITVREGMSVQAAIALAPAGAVICLEAGVWHENITIAKSLTLRGVGARGKTTIRGDDGRAPVIRVEGDQKTEVTIDWITVSWGPIGVAVVGSAQVTIGNSTVQFCGAGIAVAGSSQASITNCSVVACQLYGIYITNSARASIHATEVERNEGLSAINVDASASVSLTASMIVDNEYTGVAVGSTAEADILDTLIEGNGKDGVSIGGSARVTITNSSVVGNEWRGIALGNSPHVTLSGNRVAGNVMYGVFLYERPCAETDLVFLGYLSGRDNVIPSEFEPGGAFDPEGNEWGAVCPGVLIFLRAEEGGELERRPQPTP
jgi:parallel beta-helix repeat protein